MNGYDGTWGHREMSWGGAYRNGGRGTLRVWIIDYVWFREVFALFTPPWVPVSLFPAYRQLAVTVRDVPPQLPVCLGPGKLQAGCGVTSDTLVHDQEIKQQKQTLVLILEKQTGDCVQMIQFPFSSSLEWRSEFMTSCTFNRCEGLCF